MLTSEKKPAENIRVIHFGRPWIDDNDRQSVMDVLNGHVLTHGPKCKEFEQKFESFMGEGHAVTTSSCMASLHLSSIYIGLKPGDEVLVPAQTHVATVHAIEIMGATPVFVDCELETGNINIDLMEEKITKKTTAISLVHFAGIPIEMDRIMAIADKHNLKVIEDCALAVGGRFKGKHVGLWGDVGCFSFYPVKHITTAEGGMLISKNEETAKSISNFRAFSVDRTHQERKLPGFYNVTGVGLNYRMSELQAALGVTQLDKIDEMLRIRKENFSALQTSLKKITPELKVLDSAHKDSENSYYCLTVVCPTWTREDRDHCINSLKERGVGTSIYYPQPVPRMAYYAEKYGYEEADYPMSAIISDKSIALPVGPHLNLDDMAYIAQEFKKAFCR